MRRVREPSSPKSEKSAGFSGRGLARLKNATFDIAAFFFSACFIFRTSSAGEGNSSSAGLVVGFTALDSCFWSVGSGLSAANTPVVTASRIKARNFLIRHAPNPNQTGEALGAYPRAHL